MNPDELEELSSLQLDERLDKERAPSLCAKLSYFFCKQTIPSNLETYLQIKEKHGAEGDYSCIDNESILANYGIVIPPE